MSASTAALQVAELNWIIPQSIDAVHSFVYPVRLRISSLLSSIMRWCIDPACWRLAGDFVGLGSLGSGDIGVTAGLEMVAASKCLLDTWES